MSINIYTCNDKIQNNIQKKQSKIVKSWNTTQAFILGVIM